MNKENKITKGIINAELYDPTKDPLEGIIIDKDGGVEFKGDFTVEGPKQQEQLEMYLDTHTGVFKDKLRKQTGKGFNKYGKLTDPLDDYDWDDMAEDELVDGFIYIQMQKQKVRFIAAKLRKLTSYKQTEQTRMEIKHWLDVLEGRKTD